MTDINFAPPIRSVPFPPAGIQLAPLKCTVNRDRFGRVIYVPGDGVGVQGSGLLPRLSENAVVPHTDLFHFLVIGDYIEEEDDYVILESLAKGTAVGRLSWYAESNYTVFRMNDPDYMVLGKRAAELASEFGRRHYDYMFYARLFAWAAGYWTKELATGHFPPRPVTTDRIPYKSDRDFICIELYFAIWNLVGRRIRAHGCAPMPAEVINAVNRGTLAVIDHHNGAVGDPWREPRGPVNNYPKVVGATAEAIKTFDRLVLAKDGLVYKERPVTSNDWVPLGQAMEDLKKDTIVQLDKTRGYVTRYHGDNNISLLAQVKNRGGVNSEARKRQEEKAAESKPQSDNLTIEVMNDKRELVKPPQLLIPGDEIHIKNQIGIDKSAKPAGKREYQQREPSEEIEVAMNKRKHEPGPDIIARPLGQKRNRVHVYRQPYGWPIRSCDWVAQAPEDLEIFWMIQEGQAVGFFNLAAEKGHSICKHCRAIIEGKRVSIGGKNHGHGKGAPPPGEKEGQ
ncbi:MAG: hypothetical protein WC329_01530 [Candidatus Omnitrophota bacterium]|jgi:hypothetical protein